MPATVEILTIPLGSQLVSTIGANDQEDKNDFPVLLLFSENVSNLTESGITLSAGATFVSLEGKNSVWMATVRPPQTSGIVTVTVAANAVSEGNPRTSKNIRVSTRFPDVDAEAATVLFNHNEGGSFRGVAVTPVRIILASYRTINLNRGIFRLSILPFTHAGVKQSGEVITRDTPRHGGQPGAEISYFNGDLLLSQTPNLFISAPTAGRYSLSDLTIIESYPTGRGQVAYSRLGLMRVNNSSLFILDGANWVEHDVVSGNYNRIAVQSDFIYLMGTHKILAEITEDDEITFVKYLNISGSFGALSIYRDRLYFVDADSVYTLDIRKYRPLAKNTKTTIYPIFATAGDTIDLKQFAPDAERIVFDVGFDRSAYLSINTSNKLVLGSGAQTCLVKLKAINRIDATETDSFGFYLIIRRAEAPVWRKVSALTMRAGSSYDLFGLVPDAKSIEFRSGRTRLTDSSLSNGTFTVGTVGGVAEFTARKGSLSSHITITIDVVQGMGSDSSEVSGYRVEIAGIDVTSDSVAFPSVSETLDPIVINEYRVNEASITLRNVGGKYNSDLAGNFWETNGLNTGGFQNAVKIYLKYLDGSERLHFSGVINESFVPIKGATLKLNCSDISSRLRKARVQGFGTLEKWDSLRKQSDEDSYEGVYVPELSLLPMQVGTGKARSDRTELDISRLELPSEGPAPENTGYMTPNEFRTAGGFLPENPLLEFMGEHRSEDVRFLINQLATNKEVYNTEIDIPGVEVADPFLLNRGSVAFSVERTRTTRLPVDWVHDSTNDRILELLSNPEGHISDLLVQYDLSSDAYRVLHTFEKGVAVHRIERRSATNYYILTSAKIAQDRSARQLPRRTDGVGYAYDSIAEGSEIKIYSYSTSTWDVDGACRRRR